MNKLSKMSFLVVYVFIPSLREREGARWREGGREGRRESDGEREKEKQREREQDGGRERERWREGEGICMSMVLIVLRSAHTTGPQLCNGGLISVIFQSFYGHISVIFQSYYSYILVISQSYFSRGLFWAV